MRSYTEPEICLLLLYALPGEAPLKERLYQKLQQALYALGTGNSDPDAQLTEKELTRLGCSAGDAQAILTRLNQKDTLMRYLENLAQKGIFPVTRINPEYPRRLRQVLGQEAPLVLWCSGNPTLFQETCISLVGSRQLREKGKLFSAAAGDAIGRQGYVYCSGGAAGADTVGYQAAIRGGGSAVVFVADSLAACTTRSLYRTALRENRLLLVSEGGFDEHFTTWRALSRNRLIHAMGEKTLVAQSDYGTGGTWSGTMENLKHGWSPVLVCNEEPENPGTLGLIERGGTPIKMDELFDLSMLGALQTSLL